MDPKNNKIVIGVGVVVVLLLISWMMVSAKNKSVSETAVAPTTEAAPSTQTVTTTTTTTTTNTEVDKSSIKDLIARGGSFKCTFASNVTGAESSGTYYIVGKSIRADMMSSTGGKSVDVHIIVKDGYMYNWSNASPMAIKLPIAANDDPAASFSGATNYTQGNNALNYHCEASSVDPSLYVPPTNIKFTEMPTSAMPKK